MYTPDSPRFIIWVRLSCKCCHMEWLSPVQPEQYR